MTKELRGDHSLASHVGDQDFGDAHGTIGLLVVFEHSEVGPTDGEAGTVQGVHVLGLFRSCRFVANVRSAGLKVMEVGAGTDLAIGVLAG